MKQNMDELRKKRMAIAEKERNEKYRESYGVDIVIKVNQVLNTHLSLEDFSTKSQPNYIFPPSPSLSDCTGLVAVNLERTRAMEILSCCMKLLGTHSGMLGFDEYAYLGLANLPKIDLRALLKLAELIEDSIFFYPAEFDAVFLVDYYEIRGTPKPEDYNIVIQGGGRGRK